MVNRLLRSSTELHGENPYKAPAGPQTDRAIHERYFGSDPAILHYSSDDEAASRLKLRIKALYGHPVETGQTRTRPRRFFARFNSGPSTATEALAETLPLAICRVALVIAEARNPANR